MKVYRIAFGWWEPFPVINWILDRFIWESDPKLVEKRPPENEKSVARRTGKDEHQAQNKRTVLTTANLSSEYASGVPRYITDTFLGTPSGGDYSEKLQRDVLPYTSSDFALEFNATTIKLLFGECPYEEPSPDAKAVGNVGIQSVVSIQSSGSEDYVSTDGTLTDRSLVLKTLQSIIEKIKGSALTPIQSRSSVVEDGEHSECSATGAESTEQSQSSVAADESAPSETAVIKLNCSYDAVRTAVKTLGMKKSKGGNWDVYWTSRPIPKKVYAKFLLHQRANRFPESETLIGKNNLAAYLNRMSGIFPREYDFFPKSWSLPKEWLMLEAYAQTHADEWIIVKPHKGCGGRGIYLTRDVSKLRKCRRMQGQLYIRRPFVIDGLKFDLRIYVLLTSCVPLRIFVYNEGLARFATVEYEEPTEKNKSNSFMHLTNYSLNKRSPTYTVHDTKGTLRRFSTINMWLNTHNIDADKVSARIDDIVIKTIVAMLPTLKYNYYSTFPDQVESLSTFQIFGFDIMFDRNLKAYVLEVNSQPSLQADVPLDIEMTNALVLDTFNILNLSQRTSQYTSSTRRIKWENSHLGNFRRVYPNSNTKRYSRFMNEAEKFILANSHIFGN